MGSSTGMKRPTRIPKTLHYNFGLGADFGGKPWSLVHHVCLRSAIERIAPDEAYLYYEYEPGGPWWRLSRGLVTLVKVQAPREAFGRSLQHVAHRSDVLRLNKLIEYGGIYLDADILVQRSFDDLLCHSAVLGQQGLTDSKVGLANAVILAEPEAPFLKRWLEQYRSFRSQGLDEYYNEHSVKVPAELAGLYPEDVHVLPQTAFYWPLWTPEHLEWIFASNRRVDTGDSYATHLWESHAWKYLEGLTPGQVRRQNTNFAVWVRPYLEGLSGRYGATPLAQRARKLAGRASRKFKQWLPLSLAAGAEGS